MFAIRILNDDSLHSFYCNKINIKLSLLLIIKLKALQQILQWCKMMYFLHYSFFLFKYHLLGLSWYMTQRCSGQVLWDWTAKHSNRLSCAYPHSFFLTLYSIFILLHPSSHQRLFKCCSICSSYSPVTETNSKQDISLETWQELSDQYNLSSFKMHMFFLCFALME